MNAVATPEPASLESSRFGVALLFSLMLHGILILGIGFQFAKPAPSVPTLDVTLINTSNAQAPRRADFLAQANNAGGGNSDKAHRPGWSAFPSLSPPGPQLLLQDRSLLWLQFFARFFPTATGGNDEHGCNT